MTQRDHKKSEDELRVAILSANERLRSSVVYISRDSDYSVSDVQSRLNTIMDARQQYVQDQHSLINEFVRRNLVEWTSWITDRRLNTYAILAECGKHRSLKLELTDIAHKIDNIAETLDFMTSANPLPLI